MCEFSIRAFYFATFTLAAEGVLGEPNWQENVDELTAHCCIILHKV